MRALAVTPLLGLLGLGLSAASPLTERDTTPPPRSIQSSFSSSDKSVTIISSNTTATGVNAYAFLLSTNWVPQIRAEYYANSTSGPAATGFALSVDFWRVVEFNDTINVTESSSKYDMYNIVVDSPWNSWTNMTTNNNDVQVETFQVTNKNNTGVSIPFIENGGSAPLITLITYLASNDTVMTIPNGSTTLKTSSLKYTLTIEDWKYMYQNSKLAIVQTVHTVGFRQVENNAIVNSSVTIGTPYYSWNATAIADGAAISVDAQNLTAYSGTFGFAANLATAEAAEGASWFSGAETFDIYVFSFDKVQPQKIVWDPVLGLDDGQAGEPSVSSAPHMRTASFTMVFAIVIAVLLI
ncbi:hypothetical protein BC937DRAFT_88257 [Endogone sp. FLAS-F59071]|nr:hypothetical protein BC937DRAFT_88257 [Endogone sp. FLAS-F59071]|eukprot:RUS18862.1 hypothetical protein BC937DRAFT_88257 [Endogone sp. FLAS-F59071]